MTGQGRAGQGRTDDRQRSTNGKDCQGGGFQGRHLINGRDECPGAVHGRPQDAPRSGQVGVGPGRAPWLSVGPWDLVQAIVQLVGHGLSKGMCDGRCLHA